MCPFLQWSQVKFDDVSLNRMSGPPSIVLSGSTKYSTSHFTIQQEASEDRTSMERNVPERNLIIKAGNRVISYRPKSPFHSQYKYTIAIATFHLLYKKNSSFDFRGKAVVEFDLDSLSLSQFQQDPIRQRKNASRNARSSPRWCQRPREHGFPL